jgi:hypothetical protein
MSSSDQDVIRKFNRIARKVLRTHHSLRYWQVKGDFFAFGYTPHKQSDGKFHAMKFRSNKEVKRLMFSSRKVAKKRVYHWYCQRKAALSMVAAAKPVKPAPTKLEILQKTIQEADDKLKEHQKKAKLQETLIKKWQRRRKTLQHKFEFLHEQEALAEYDQAKREQEDREASGKEPKSDE